MSADFPVDRRTALRTALALGAGVLYFVRDSQTADAGPNSEPWSDEVRSPVWSIRGGSGVGPISLAMPEAQVIAILGQPQDIYESSGITVEQIRQALGDLYEPEENHAYPPTRCLQYFELGVCVQTVDSLVSLINIYTGCLTGYDKGHYAPFQGRFESRRLALVTGMDEIVQALGPPCERGELEHAPIPEEWLRYGRLGLSFDFHAETKQLSCVHVCRSDGHG